METAYESNEAFKHQAFSMEKGAELRRRVPVDDKKNDDELKSSLEPGRHDYSSDDSSSQSSTADASPKNVVSMDVTETVISRDASRTSQLFRRVLWILLLDIPVFVTLTFRLSSSLVDYFAREYILPQMEFHRWDDHTNAAMEYTYYFRECNASTITASTPAELVFEEDMSTDDALELFNTHGVIMLPQTISPETAAELREFILEENLRSQDVVDIFENENRWSFAIQIDHHPSVAKAAREILSNQRFVAAIEKIVGPNPAVTEFTAITVAPGAKAQIYHTDSGPSANRYSRSFFPTYSFFTPLQNTTAGMGATDICPGTHMCSSDSMPACYTRGFSVAGPDDNWPVGWTAMTSQQTFHRGAAYSDPEGEPRVMFYFTFAPRPRFNEFELETRTFARGGTYGQYWGQWGHTMRDYAHPERYMRQPWRLLRTYGLYKPRGRQWGWDYLTLSTCALATSVYDYDDEDYVKMQERGGLPFLPKFLQANVSIVTDEEPVEDDDVFYDDENENYDGKVWHEFFSQTIERCKVISRMLHLVALGLYSLAVLGAITIGGKRGKVRFLTSAVGRLIVMHAVLLLAQKMIVQHVANLSWARSIKAGRLFEVSDSYHLAPNLPGTIPTVNDILILDDMRSDYLGSFSTVLDTFQVGNKAFMELLASRSAGYASLSTPLQRNLCSSVLRWSRQAGHRVLVKNRDFDWAVAEPDRALRFCHKELMKLSNPFVSKAITELDYLIAETKFGYWRDTRMHEQHIPRYLVKLQDRLMLLTDHPGQNSRLSAVKRLPGDVIHPFVASKLTKWVPPSPMLTRLTAYVVSQEPEVGPPFPEAWLQQGDLVEATDKQDMRCKLFDACVSLHPWCSHAAQ